MSEMRETTYLLQHVTNTSLVIIDELGRGTSPSDALGITAAVSEDLIRTRVRMISNSFILSNLKKIQAFCFFATHLHELTRTLNVYPNVVNLQFKVHVTVSGSKYSFEHIQCVYLLLLCLETQQQ